jgi:tRNA threonylcarbamoyladenosine biosynthesis protein TsaE
MKQKYFLNNIWELNFPIKEPCIIFLRGDLWAWKTTLSQHILWNILWVKDEITSPTYTYYNKYGKHYHFDLYRINDYDEFFAIGWEDVLDNLEWVALIEWPEKIEKYYSPDINIWLFKTENPDQREIEITKKAD